MYLHMFCVDVIRLRLANRLGSLIELAFMMPSCILATTDVNLSIITMKSLAFDAGCEGKQLYWIILKHLQ